MDYRRGLLLSIFRMFSVFSVSISLLFHFHTGFAILTNATRKFFSDRLFPSLSNCARVTAQSLKHLEPVYLKKRNFVFIYNLIRIVYHNPQAPIDFKDDHANKESPSNFLCQCRCHILELIYAAKSTELSRRSVIHFDQNQSEVGRWH